MDDDLELFADGRLDEPEPVTIPRAGWYCRQHGFVGRTHWCSTKEPLRHVASSPSPERPE